MSSRYQGQSRSSRWGFFAAVVVGMPLFLCLLFVDALGDCAPDSNCRHGSLAMVLLPTVLAAAAVFLAVRLAINRFSRPK